MNIYKITKGQLFTIWIFGLMFWIFNFFSILDSYESSGWQLFMMVFIPGALVFYTIGWKNLNKSEGDGVLKKTSEFLKGLLRRSNNSSPVKKETFEERKGRLFGIKGWYKFFSIFMLIGYLYLFSATVYISFPDNDLFKFFYFAFMALVVIVFVLTLRAVGKLAKNTVWWQKIGVLVFITASFLQMMLIYLSGNYEKSSGETINLFIMISVVYFVYLLVAERVKITFPKSERKVSLIDKVIPILLIVALVSMFAFPSSNHKEYEKVKEDLSGIDFTYDEDAGLSFNGSEPSSKTFKEFMSIYEELSNKFQELDADLEEKLNLLEPREIVYMNDYVLLSKLTLVKENNVKERAIISDYYEKFLEVSAMYKSKIPSIFRNYDSRETTCIREDIFVDIKNAHIAVIDKYIEFIDFYIVNNDKIYIQDGVLTYETQALLDAANRLDEELALKNQELEQLNNEKAQGAKKCIKQLEEVKSSLSES